MKEKIKKEAEELVGRFYEEIPSTTVNPVMQGDRKRWQAAKQCAVIHLNLLEDNQIDMIAMNGLHGIQSATIRMHERLKNIQKVKEYIQTKI